MRADRRLWRTADGKRLVDDGDPAAAFLAYAAGDEVAEPDRRLVDAPAEPEPEPEPEEDPDDDGQDEDAPEEDAEPEKVEEPAPAKKPTRRTRTKGGNADGSRW